MSNEFDKTQLVDIFVAESSDAISTMQAALSPADQSLPSPQMAHEQKSLAHRTKGAALLYEFPTLGKLCDMLEHLLERATDFSSSDWPRVVGTLRTLVDAAQVQINAIAHSHQEQDDSLTAVKAEYAEALILLKAAQDPPPEPLDASYLLPAIDDEVLSYFLPEMEEHLCMIQGHVEQLAANPDDPERVHQLFRSVHTVKGSAHTVGFTVIGDITLPLEERLGETRDHRSPISSRLLELTTETMRMVRRLLSKDPSQLDSLQRELPALVSSLQAYRPASSPEPDSERMASPPPPVPIQASVAAVPACDPTAEATHHPQDLTIEYLCPVLDPEVLSYFVPEAQEHLDALEALLLKLEKTPHSMELIHQLFRSAHTLKGSALTVGFTCIGDLVHYVEDLMGALREGRMKLLAGMTDLILRSIDVVRLLMRRDPATLPQVRERFRAVAKELQGFARPAASATGAVAAAHSAPPTEQAASAPQDTREAPQTEDASGPQGHDVIRVNRERLERLLNLVGELVIGRGRLEQRLLVLEHLSNQVQSFKGKMLETVRSFEEKHSFTLPTVASSAGSPSSPAHVPGLQDFGALEFDKYDDFNILARRISEVTADVTESMAQLSGSIRQAREDMSQLQHLTLGMRDEIARARMVAIGTPFTRFRRAVREMARATGKEVTLVTSGEHTEVDTGIVERLVEPLVHLVRNAVYHGIEAAGVRVAQCKPAVGTVYLHAAHRGNAVIIEVEDDGAGIDTEKVKAKAVAKGLVPAALAKTMPDSEAMKLIFLPGFSTADEVGDQAGRGVGLDAVKKVIESMNGFVDIETAKGVGTKFTLSLPLTLLIATALIVRAGMQRYAIPLPSVREVTIPTSDSLQRIASDLILHAGDEAIPVQSLMQALSGIPSEVPEFSPIVIVRAPNGSLGLAVDELLGRQEIVVKSLGSLKVLDRSSFGGASIDPEGRVILVVDVTRIGQGDRTASLSAMDPVEPPLLSDTASSSSSAVQEAVSTGPSILLIDDSLSIRKFVARMLENAGYAVDTAVDGEDGLRKAAANHYRLVITDLEMPKLNGYEVIQALRGRTQSQTLPIVVMTTRAGDKHRQLALNIGASGYIAKPVEERALIAEVERWLQLPSSTRT